MHWKELLAVVVLVAIVLCAGCMESVDYQPPKASGVGNGNFSQNAASNNPADASNASDLNPTQPPVMNTSSNTTEGVNGTIIHHEVNFTAVENITGGTAVSGENGTYQFKINDQASVGGKVVKVERIWKHLS